MRRLKVRLLPAVVVENHFWRAEIKLAADLKAVLCRSRRLWLFISAPLVSKQVIRTHRHVFREPFCSVFSGDESYSAQPRPLLVPLLPFHKKRRRGKKNVDEAKLIYDLCKHGRRPPHPLCVLGIREIYLVLLGVLVLLLEK